MAQKSKAAARADEAKPESAKTIEEKLPVKRKSQTQDFCIKNIFRKKKSRWHQLEKTNVDHHMAKEVSDPISGQDTYSRPILKKLPLSRNLIRSAI